MTNEELAMSLLAIFKPFGPVVSVKASRDQKGRPFGFVEYQTSDSAVSALAYGPCLTLDSRRIRVEPAKRQRKLCIKYRLSEGETLETALSGMRTDLQTQVCDEDFKLSLQLGNDAEQEFFGAEPESNEQMIAAVIKFEDSIKAKRAYEEWKGRHPEWTLTWINMDRAAFGSNVRNSGLVQLVPNNDGSIMIPSSVYPPMPPSRYTSPPSLFYESPASPIQTIPTAPYPSPRYTPTYEEEYFDNTSDMSLIMSFEKMSLETDSLGDWLGRTLFVGRLNGQSVTLQMLNEHFRSYGPITFVRLYNRGVVGFDGVPMDAYAFIRFERGESVEEAINKEHGRVWLGQAIKCEHARPMALSIMLSGERKTTSPVQSLPMMTVYYPNYLPMVKEPNLVSSNWFRAKGKVID